MGLLGLTSDPRISTRARPSLRRNRREQSHRYLLQQSTTPPPDPGPVHAQALPGLRAPANPRRPTSTAAGLRARCPHVSAGGDTPSRANVTSFDSAQNTDTARQLARRLHVSTFQSQTPAEILQTDPFNASGRGRGAAAPRTSAAGPPRSGQRRAVSPGAGPGVPGVAAQGRPRPRPARRPAAPGPAAPPPSLPAPARAPPTAPRPSRALPSHVTAGGAGRGASGDDGRRSGREPHTRRTSRGS